MPNKQNIGKFNNISEKLKSAKALFIVEYKGLGSNNANILRKKVREVNAELQVAKNTLLRIALEENKYEGGNELSQSLEGQNATIFAYGDALEPLKNIVELSKTIDAIKLKGGIVEGQFADENKLEMLSKLPSRDQLIAQVIGTMKSPLNGFVNVLSGTQRKLVYALSAVAKSKE